MLLGALAACTAFADITVEALAQTPAIPSFTAGDPAIGTRVIGTDRSMNSFYAYNRSGVQQQFVPVGLNGAADLRDGVLAVAVPNTGVLFFYESSLVEMSLTDGGSPTLNLPQVSMVALGTDAIGNTRVFANNGGTTVYEFAYGNPAPISSVVLSGAPRGLAWFGGKLYATLSDSVVSAEGTTVKTVISDNMGSAEGIVVTTIGDGTYALLASSTDNSIYVHQLSAPTGFIGKFSVTSGTSKVSPRYLASNGTTLVVQDELTANYKILELSQLGSALGISLGVTLDGGFDGGPGAADAGQSNGPGGVVPGGGGGGEPLPLCGCAAPPLLFVPALLLLMLRRKFRR